MSVANVKDGYLDLSLVKTMAVSESEAERHRLRPGDVLFTEGEMLTSSAVAAFGEVKLSYGFTKIPTPNETLAPFPSNVAKYVQEFDALLPEEEFQSPHFAYRLLFVRKLTSKRNQADRAIEFIPYVSPYQTLEKAGRQKL